MEVHVDVLLQEQLLDVSFYYTSVLPVSCPLGLNFNFPIWEADARAHTWFVLPRAGKWADRGQANVAIDLKRDWLSSSSPVRVAWKTDAMKGRTDE